jgi:hypothetical protein
MNERTAYNSTPTVATTGTTFINKACEPVKLPPEMVLLITGNNVVPMTNPIIAPMKPTANSEIVGIFITPHIKNVFASLRTSYKVF